MTVRRRWSGISQWTKYGKPLSILVPLANDIVKYLEDNPGKLDLAARALACLERLEAASRGNHAALEDQELDSSQSSAPVVDKDTCIEADTESDQHESRGALQQQGQKDTEGESQTQQEGEEDQEGSSQSSWSPLVIMA